MEEILSKYPYFLMPLIQRYNDTETDADEKERLRNLITVNIGDSEALLRVLGELKNDNSAPEVHASFDTIDAFLQNHSTQTQGGGYLDLSDTDQDSNEYLRELIKNHKYYDAIKIIEHRNLINPQKNIYFAHQIRFLKKLIEIQKNKIKP